MSDTGTESEWIRLDWEKAHLQPMVVDGFMLIVSGTAPIPMEVKLRPTPIGIVPEDYRGVEVVGKPAKVTTQVETKWTAQIEAKGLSGRKGFVLVGATMHEYFPPKEED